jgi:serine/threonine protein phosphatase PrpC
MLAGKYQQNPLEAQLEQRLKPMQDMMAQMQARESQLSQQIGREAGENIEAFGEDPANEFFEDVRADMADIIDLATQRGQKMSLKQAYDRAIMMNEEIADVVSQRKLAETIQQSQKPVQAAKRAAVSVTGAPTVGAAGGESGSLRDSILNAMDSQS